MSYVLVHALVRSAALSLAREVMRPIMAAITSTISVSIPGIVVAAAIAVAIAVVELTYRQSNLNLFVYALFLFDLFHNNSPRIISLKLIFSDISRL